MATNTIASLENSKKVMNLAWGFRKTYQKSMSDSMKLAWRNFKLKREMQKGVVEFHFTKADGTIRQAFGTIASNLVPATVGADRKTNVWNQTYFDVERAEWRTFKKVNLL